MMNVNYVYGSSAHPEHLSEHRALTLPQLLRWGLFYLKKARRSRDGEGKPMSVIIKPLELLQSEVAKILEQDLVKPSAAELSARDEYTESEAELRARDRYTESEAQLKRSMVQLCLLDLKRLEEAKTPESAARAYFLLSHTMIRLARALITEP